MITPTERLALLLLVWFVLAGVVVALTPALDDARSQDFESSSSPRLRSPAVSSNARPAREATAVEGAPPSATAAAPGSSSGNSHPSAFGEGPAREEAAMLESRKARPAASQIAGSSLREVVP